MAASIFRDEVRDVLFRKARQCTKKNEVVRVSPAGEWDPSRLKKLRSSLHISQAVLADIMGVSKAAVIAWEHGVNIPSGACARLLAGPVPASLISYMPIPISCWKPGWSRYMKSRGENIGRAQERRRLMEYKSFYDSPVGRIVMISDGNALSYLGFEDQRFENPVLPSLVEKEDMPAVFLARKWLDIYFSGRDPGFRVPLSLTGSTFITDRYDISEDRMGNPSHDSIRHHRLIFICGFTCS